MLSKLCDLIIISPNCNSPRSEDITGIAIHHMAGDLSAEQCGLIFQDPTREGSSNYGIGSDGAIGGYVDEDNRAWTTGGEWDNHLVTIEVADYAPDWNVSDKAYASLIDLCTDICYRNNLTLNYTGNTEGNLVMHRWYQATACPGDWLADRFQDIADEVNARLNNNGWFKFNDTWYFVEDSVLIKHDFRQDKDGNWYFLDDDGKMATSTWISWKNRWCYVGEDGKTYTDGWYKIAGDWYIFDSDGYTLYSQWVHNDSGTWSYVDDDGQAVYGWHKLNWEDSEDYYYFDNNGVMVTDTWIKEYFVCNTGKMLKSCWIGHDNKWYWVGIDGAWLDYPTWQSETRPVDGYDIYEY